ncbi:MAG: hypothetical protein Q8O67_23470 [Deltaproteobacteria bacterium]|nr:hypothetical protein [Deltaproteobacteria bacterium]
MLALLALLLIRDAPPPPAPPVAPMAWACDRATLLAGLACTFEGKTKAAEPSQGQVEDNQRQARALGAELCAAASTGRAKELINALKAICDKRMEAEAAACGGDGSRRLLDDDGRFNAGHAVCYAALRSVVVTTQRGFSEANQCCACLDAARGATFDQCVAAADVDRLPAGAGDKACRSSCAALLLRSPVSPAPAAAPVRRP